MDHQFRKKMMMKVKEEEGRRKKRGRKFSTVSSLFGNEMNTQMNRKRGGTKLIDKVGPAACLMSGFRKKTKFQSESVNF